jgi:hypothetical protein
MRSEKAYLYDYGVNPKKGGDEAFLKKDRVRTDIFDYIDVFYNRSRRQSHLGADSPEAFEPALW